MGARRRWPLCSIDRENEDGHANRGRRVVGIRCRPVPAPPLAFAWWFSRYVRVDPSHCLSARGDSQDSCPITATAVGDRWRVLVIGQCELAGEGLASRSESLAREIMG